MSEKDRPSAKLLHHTSPPLVLGLVGKQCAVAEESVFLGTGFHADSVPRQWILTHNWFKA